GIRIREARWSSQAVSRSSRAGVAGSVAPWPRPSPGRGPRSSWPRLTRPRRSVPTVPSSRRCRRSPTPRSRHRSSSRRPERVPPITTRDPRWIETPPALAEVSRRLREPGEVALDTEGDSLHHYPERLSLIQLAMPSSDVWLVDPLALGDLSPLASVFAAPSGTTGVPAGANDVVQLKRRGIA